MEKTEKQSGLPAKCMSLTKNLKKDGEYLKQKDAGDYVMNYLNGVKDPTGAGHNFGYVFGLDRMVDFMGKIATYNIGKPTAAQIQGVRVYVSRKAPIKAGAIVPGEKIMDTVFLMPVMANGTDLYKIPPFVDPDMILGNPRPCPNECLVLSFVEI